MIVDHNYLGTTKKWEAKFLITAIADYRFDRAFVFSLQFTRCNYQGTAGRKERLSQLDRTVNAVHIVRIEALGERGENSKK